MAALCVTGELDLAFFWGWKGESLFLCLLQSEGFLGRFIIFCSPFASFIHYGFDTEGAFLNYLLLLLFKLDPTSETCRKMSLFFTAQFP